MGADLTANSRIDHVTVYRQGALVTRVAEVSIPTGTHRVIFRDLPAGVDPKTLQISVGNVAVQVGGIEVARINEPNFVSEAERELRQRIEEAGDQQAVLKDEVATAQNQIALLDSLAANPAGGPNKAVVDATNLAAVLGTMATGESAARRRIRDANMKLRVIDRQLEQLKADLSKIATTSRQSTEVRATVVADAPMITGAAVSYRITSAEWNWIYQARLDTARKHLVVERQGSVTQGTGEDWKNIELTLTTSMPAEDLETPIISSVFVDLVAPEPVTRFGPVNRNMLMAAPAPAAAAEAQEVIVTGARREHATTTATDYIADYRVPSRVSLLADRQPRVFPIGDNAFDVTLVVRVVPSVDHAGHLEAVFKYSDPLPIEAGQLQLYRDGAYVGEAETEAFLPGADVRMPFGVDERIRVSVRDEATQSGQKGLLSRQTVKETRERVDITNYHPTMIPVEMVDRIPVSKNADVHVDTLKGATEPSVRDLDGKAGVWLWKLDPEPQQTVTVHEAYAIQFPAGQRVQESDGPAAP